LAQQQPILLSLLPLVLIPEHRVLLLTGFNVSKNAVRTGAYAASRASIAAATFPPAVGLTNALHCRYHISLVLALAKSHVPYARFATVFAANLPIELSIALASELPEPLLLPEPPRMAAIVNANT